MNAEVSTSTSAVAAPAGPIAGTPTGEFKSFGANPTFSGLQRTDSTNPFSVNEGPRGPVSFTNSTDLFAETKAFGTPSFGVPEVAAKGDLFGQTEIISAGPKQESAEQHVLAEVNRSEVEDLRTNDPLTYQQLKSDLEIVDNILDLVDQVNAGQQTVTQISNHAIETAVKRSGLVQDALKSSQDPTEEENTEPEGEETQVEVGQTRINEQTEEIFADVKVVTDETPVPQNKKERGNVRDEDANEARVEHRKEALRLAVEKDVDPQTGKLKGEDVIERVIAGVDEQSDLAKSQGVDDGSIPEADKAIAGAEFESMSQAETVIFEAVDKNTGVKRGTAGQRATSEEVKKVLKGKGTSQSEDELLKAA